MLHVFGIFADKVFIAAQFRFPCVDVMTLLGMSANLKTFDVDNAGYLVPNPHPELPAGQANIQANPDNSYMDMNKNNKINDDPPIKDEGYIEISNAKKQVRGRKNLAEAVRYSKSPGQNSRSQNQEDDHPDDSVYTEIFFRKNYSDREPIFYNKDTNPKLISINVLLFVLILLLAVPIVYLFVVIQGQNRTLVTYEGKIKLLEEKLLTFATQVKNWEEQRCCNSSTELRRLNESLETLAQITFTKIDINSNVTLLDSRTALHIAAKDGLYDRIKFLISHGANLEVKDLSGFTPLQLAALYRHVDIINLLLDEGAMVDGENSLRKTALFFAIRNDCLPCVKALLGRGADVFHRDAQDIGPLDFANQNHHREIAKFVQEFMEKNTTRLL